MDPSSTPQAQTTSVKSSVDKECHFFRLPAELRTRIYELVLVVHENPDQPLFITLTSGNPKPTVLALLATCRQINTEAAGIFYNLNNLHMELRWLLHNSDFPEITSANRLASIDRLTICLGKLQTIRDATLGCRKNSERMPRLRSLTFKGDYSVAAKDLIDSMAPEQYWRLHSRLVKMPKLEEITYVQEPINSAGQDGKALLEKWAEELSANWSERTGKPKTMSWKFE